MNDSPLTPDTWLSSVVDTLQSRHGAVIRFKVLPSAHINVVRILHMETGAVWSFLCSVERGPA